MPGLSTEGTTNEYRQSPAYLKVAPNGSYHGFANPLTEMMIGTNP